ncbi:MAG: hypothetical protein ACREKL_14135 [Chthoniobacterales bacterium]
MRPLNRNERMLATLLGAVAFLVINFAGMKWVANRTTMTRAEITQLKTEAEAARNLLKQRPYWLVRQDWVAAHPPAAYDDKTSRAQFVQDVTEGMKKQSLTIEAQQPLETERDGRLAITGIELTVTGKLESIVRWLYSLQQPGNYQFVRSFTLRQSDEGTTMQAVVRLGKVFRSGDLASYP